MQELVTRPRSMFSINRKGGGSVDEQYQILANAVVLQACADFVDCADCRKEVRYFFRSKAFSTFCQIDSEVILKRCIGVTIGIIDSNIGILDKELKDERTTKRGRKSLERRIKELKDERDTTIRLID